MVQPRHKEDLNDLATTNRHRQIINKNTFLRKIYREWYLLLKQNINPNVDGDVVEIGSGGGFIKEVIPETITSDIQELSYCDMTFSAEKMPFENSSLQAILLINVFHHIPSPLEFLREADRCLNNNGRIVMIEPSNTLFARFIYSNFHHEDFDQKAGWELKESGKPLSVANGALPWIFFKRDRDKLNTTLPGLKILNLEPIMPIKYLLSGGFAYRSLVPGALFGVASFIEKILYPLHGVTGLFQIIVIEKHCLNR